MEVDWFTLIAQVINFLVLVYLLKRFLYGPILKAMEERQGKIAAQLEEAEEKKQSAEREKRQYQEKNKLFERRSKQMLARASQEAEAHRRKLIEEARREVDELQEGWFRALTQERDAMFQELRRQTVQHVCMAIRRALADLADGEVERQIVRVFLERLGRMDGEERQKMMEGMREAGRVEVLSAFDIPGPEKQIIRDALQDWLPSDDVDVHFRHSPDLIAGIELRAGGCKLAWSLDDYVRTMEENLAQVIEAQTQKTLGRSGEVDIKESIGEAGAEVAGQFVPGEEML